MNHAPRQDRLRTGLFVAGIIVILQTFYLGVFGTNTDRTLHLPAGAWLKNQLKIKEELSPRIRIIAGSKISNPASAAKNLESPAIQRSTDPLSVQQWQVVLNSLARSKAQKILVAGDFTSQRWNGLDLNKLGGKFVFSTMLENQASNWNQDHTVKLGNIKDTPHDLGPLQIMGPSGHFSGKVSFGHIGPWNKYEFWPMMQTDSVGENQWSRHLALSGGANVKREEMALVSGDKKISLSQSGSLFMIPLNDSTINNATHNIYEFAQNPKMFTDSLKGNEIVFVQEKSLFEPSKGLSEELSLLVTITQNQLMEEWISPARGYNIFSIFLILATIMSAFMLSAKLFSFIVFPALTLLAGAGPFLLLTNGILFPWSEVAFVMAPSALAGGIYALLRDRFQNKEHLIYFSRMFSAKDAKEFAKDFSGKKFCELDESGEKLVTIVNIDIVDFSKTIENTPPGDTANQISNFLSALVDTVHAHGGFISELSPDRILAVFGHGLLKSSKALGRNQVTQAILCARDIQNISVTKIRDFSTNVMPPFPVRVSVNTATARICLLAIRGSIECKVIGAAADLARQLASYCEPFRILVSSSSIEILKKEEGGQLEKWSTPRSVKLPDSKIWLSAFEFNPFDHDKEQLKQAVEIFRSYNKIKREDNRFAFKKGLEPLLQSEVGQFEILDFSYTGLRVRAQDFLSVGATVDFWPAEFEAASTPFKAKFSVHWGVPEKNRKDSFILGVRYSSDSDLELISQYFHSKLSDTEEEPNSQEDRYAETIKTSTKKQNKTLAS